jgi:UDP-glucose 4-epimerase
MNPDVFEQGFHGVSVLITGGAGFIGSHLANRLHALGAHVRVLDDLSGGFRENLDAGIDLRVASILDDRALRKAASSCRFVFHEAAMVSVPESVEKPEECLNVNVIGTQRVLAAAKDGGAQRVIFAASAAAYGPQPHLPSREDHVPDCVSPYAASKVAGETLMRSFASCYGLSTVSLRYFNIFGPRQNPDSPYAAVISAFTKKLAAGLQPTVLGDGTQTRDFTYIDNVVHANLLAAVCDKPLAGEVVNIGTGRRISLLDVLNTMGRALNFRVEPIFGPPRPGDVPHSQADIARARDLLDYVPMVSFEAGIDSTLREYTAEARITPERACRGGRRPLDER